MTAQKESSVTDYIASLDAQTAQDSHVLIEVMQRISGHLLGIVSISSN